MAANILELANQVLVLLGAATITDLSSVTESRAVVLNSAHPTVRKALLELFPWPFAQIRSALATFVTPAGTLTPGAGATVVDTTGVTFTASSSVFAAGDVGKSLRKVTSTTSDLSDGNVADLRGRALITAFGSGTSVTCTIQSAFNDLTAIPSGLWRMYFATPAFGFDKSVAVPAGFLRVQEKDVPRTNVYRLEGATFFTDQDFLRIKYISDITDTTKWSGVFEQLFVQLYAATVALGVTGRADLSGYFMSLFWSNLQRVLMLDEQQYHKLGGPIPLPQVMLTGSPQGA